MDFFHCRKHYYELWTRILARRAGLKLKLKLTLMMMDGLVNFSLHKTLTDGLEWCGLLVDYCDVFISCLDSLSAVLAKYGDPYSEFMLCI